MKFVDDDEGYLAWLREHPRGYVVNAERRPRSEYLVLHRATCHTISGKAGSWTKTYTKVCAKTVADLDAWAHTETGGYPSRCGFCPPS